MRDIRLRGKAFFQGLMAVLVSPTPIKVLCIFGTHKAMRDQMYECADQVLKLGQGFVVKIMDNTIVTPIGSELIFKSIEQPEDMMKVQGIEVHDLWVSPAHPFAKEVWDRLQCRARL